MIESDFLREYRIDLFQEITSMSWRRFKVLLRGLSSQSCWYIINQKTKPNDIIITDNVVAEREVNKIWG